jgi:hypothetical protein
VQKAFKTLEGIIGLKISCDLEWDMLWTELGPKFPDKATFVPNVAGVIAAWCEVLGTRLEDDGFAEWTEDLIGKLQSGRSVKLHVQVCCILYKGIHSASNNLVRYRTILDRK